MLHHKSVRLCNNNSFSLFGVQVSILDELTAFEKFKIAEALEVYIYMFMYIYIYIYIHIYIHIYIYVYIYMCMYACVHIFVCVYI